MRILVVEDDKDALEMYRIVLESRGHDVETATDGQECIEMYKKRTKDYDAVIVDYKLPVLDGLRVAKEILDIVPDQRIVLVSAILKQTLVDSVKDLKRIVEIVIKPFDPELLADLVEDRLSLAKLQELNIDVAEIAKRGSPPSQTEIDNLLQKLKGIQKPDTI